MAENLESLARRFLSTVGVTEPAGYQTIDVLLDERAQPFFGGRDHLQLAFSPEAAREHPEAELVTYGSSFLDTMAEVALFGGRALHLYLNGLSPTTGRTLEKVRAQTRLPGRLLEAGKEQVLQFHHAFFRFKVTLTGEEREELFQDIAVDLHTGWTTAGMDTRTLRICISGEVVTRKELSLRLSLGQAYLAAVRRLEEEMAPQVKAYEEDLKAALQADRKQVTEHYEALIARMEASKTHKGAEPERLEAKIQATQADLGLRIQDLEKRYRLGREITLMQLALVSYPKAVVPLRLQQGKEIKAGAAIWDSLVRQGYIGGINTSA